MERNPRALLCVALIVVLGFALGCSEFVVIGVEADIAASYSVSLARVGELISLFAVAYAVLTPVLALTTGRFRRFQLLVVYSIVFCLANLLQALAPSFEMLLASRVLIGGVSGALLALGVTYLPELVAKERVSMAISVVYAAFSVAMVVITSMGKLVAEMASWRAIMVAACLLAVVVGGARVQDSHAGFHDMDFRTAVAQSSNVYFAEAVYERYADRKEAYSDFLRTLHLDRTVGLEAYGERSPYFPSDWKRIGGANQALARLAFGYVIELTPMQMITLYNAVANDGRMVAPHLVRELRRGDVLERRIRPEVLEEQICSQSTLRKVQDLLVEVCRSGTAAPYFHDTTRYRAAAKTGTAQFAQNGIRYSDGYYMGSMVAYFPAEKPRYTILTTIHTRRGGGKAYYGGPLAGPVVKRMADYIYNREQEWHATLDVPHDAPYADPQRPQRIKGGDIAAVRKVADVLDARSVSYESRTGWGRARVDSASRVEITTVAEDPSLVPDVRGMGLKDALFLMESRGLRVSFSGTGAVQQQSLAPGTRAVHGAAVHLTLR